MKYILFLLAVSLCYSGMGQDSTAFIIEKQGSYTIRPCTIDTLKGILMWHNPKTYENDGSAYDSGYWIGLCGPAGAFMMPDMLFIPGTFKRTMGYKNPGDKHWRVTTVPREDDGFYDSKFRHIPGREVYGLIIKR